MFLSNSLGVSAFGSPIERYRLSLKLDLLPPRNSLTGKDTHRLNQRKETVQKVYESWKKTDVAMQLFWAILEVIKGSIH